MAYIAGAIPVSGICRGCGETVNERSPRGKVTWRGPCPKCGTKVIARKTSTTTEPDTSPRGRKATRVDGYDTGTGNRSRQRTTAPTTDDNKDDGKASGETPDVQQPADDDGQASGRPSTGGTSGDTSQGGDSRRTASDSQATPPGRQRRRRWAESVTGVYPW